MSKHCLSCGMGINEENARGSYCMYCTDENGSLISREAMKAGLTEWLKGITPNGENVDFEKRAEHYMKAMPAWAD